MVQLNYINLQIIEILDIIIMRIKAILATKKVTDFCSTIVEKKN